VIISGHPSGGTRRSNPAEKVDARPVRTTIASSSSARSKPDISSPSIAGESALTLPSSIAIVAIAPSSA